MIIGSCLDLSETFQSADCDFTTFLVNVLVRLCFLAWVVRWFDVTFDLQEVTMLRVDAFLSLMTGIFTPGGILWRDVCSRVSAWDADVVLRISICPSLTIVFCRSRLVVCGGLNVWIYFSAVWVFLGSIASLWRLRLFECLLVGRKLDCGRPEAECCKYE